MKPARTLFAGLFLVTAFVATAWGGNNGKNPFERILDRLDSIDTQITSSQSGEDSGVKTAIDDLQADVDSLQLDMADVLDSLDGLEGGGEATECLAPWSRTLSDDDRFELVMNDEAVLDRETGLVWARAAQQVNTTWLGVKRAARAAIIGGRAGWRLPSYEELASIVDVEAWQTAQQAGDLVGTNMRTIPPSSLFDASAFPAVGFFQIITDTTEDVNASATPQVVYLQPVGDDSVSHRAVTSTTSGRGGFVWFVRGGSAYDGR